VTTNGSIDSAPGESIRAFVAIYPDEITAGELKKTQHKLQMELNRLKIRWLPPEQWHLTLQFLGNLKSSRLPEFETAIEKVAGQTASFTATAEHLGCFPNAKRPSIIWAGLNRDPGPILSFKAQLDAELVKLGFVLESRPFHPHFTLGRVREVRTTESREIAEALHRHASTQFGSWPIKTVELMRSELSPRGATHSILRSFALAS
jgi:RNA 2',3'-cyclic 3'-phosphodiesterase